MVSGTTKTALHHTDNMVPIFFLLDTMWVAWMNPRKSGTELMGSLRQVRLTGIGKYNIFGTDLDIYRDMDVLEKVIEASSW